jgi:saccharopine dehydrogenase (NAD+, L-lysine-forming)
MMIFKGEWKGAGVFNVEELPPAPFLAELPAQGLPWHERELSPSEQSELFALKT